MSMYIIYYMIYIYIYKLLYNSMYHYYSMCVYHVHIFPRVSWGFVKPYEPLVERHLAA